MYTTEQLNKFTEILTEGGVAAAPAEGVYGYCCDALNPKALQKVVELKQRTPEKGFVVLIGDLKQLDDLCEGLTCQQHEMMDLHWPGQVTLVLPVKKGLPELLTGGFDTIAVRFPKPDYMRQYLIAWGKPMVSTSANISGEPPIYEQQFLPTTIYALPTVQKLEGSVSKLIDATTGQQYR